MLVFLGGLGFLCLLVLLGSLGFLRLLVLLGWLVFFGGNRLHESLVSKKFFLVFLDLILSLFLFLKFRYRFLAGNAPVPIPESCTIGWGGPNLNGFLTILEDSFDTRKKL